MMEKYFATYNQSLALKELGFDMPCFRYVYIGDTGNNIDRYEEVEPSRAINYNHDSLCVSQPLKSQVFEWFREKHGLFSEIQPYLIIGTQWRYTITNRNNSSGLPHKEQFKTYEEAESACIDKLIEIVKNGRK